MPEAVLEPPKETPTPNIVGGPISLPDLDDLLKTPAAKKEAPKVEVKEEKKEEPPVEKKEEPPKEQSPKEAVKETPKETPQELNFRNLREKADREEKRAKELDETLTKLRQEHEALKTNPAIPEEVTQKLTRLEQQEKELDELRKHVRAADITRDPEYQQKYVKGIQGMMNTMRETAMSAGIPAADVHAAISAWNEDKFGEWIETMPAGAKAKFQAAWGTALQLDNERRDVVANSEQNWERLNKERQEQMQRQQREAQEATQKVARSIADETLSKLPEAFRDDEDLRKGITVMMDKVAKGELGAKEVYGHIATNQVLVRVVNQQKANLEAALTEVETLKAKVDEQEKFINEHKLSTPKGSAAGSSGELAVDKPIWDQIEVRT